MATVSVNNSVHLIPDRKKYPYAAEFNRLRINRHTGEVLIGIEPEKPMYEPTWHLLADRHATELKSAARSPAQPVDGRIVRTWNDDLYRYSFQTLKWKPYNRDQTNGVTTYQYTNTGRFKIWLVRDTSVYGLPRVGPEVLSEELDRFLHIPLDTEGWHVFTDVGEYFCNGGRWYPVPATEAYPLPNMLNVGRQNGKTTAMRDAVERSAQDNEARKVAADLKAILDMKGPPRDLVMRLRSFVARLENHTCMISVGLRSTEDRAAEMQRILDEKYGVMVVRVVLEDVLREVDGA